METRMLTEGDAADWWHLRLQALEEEPFAFGRSAEEHRRTGIDTIAARFRDAPRESFTLGAFDNQRLVGTAGFVRETGLKERHKGQIFGFYVAPSARRKGVAKALLSALVETASADASLEQILLEVGTRQEPAHALYQVFGFGTYGVEPNALKVGGEYIDVDHMILRLR